MTVCSYLVILFFFFFLSQIQCNCLCFAYLQFFLDLQSVDKKFSSYKYWLMVEIYQRIVPPLLFYTITLEGKKRGVTSWKGQMHDNLLLPLLFYEKELGLLFCVTTFWS